MLSDDRKASLAPIGPIGLYIHIPFCLSKCPYCDFYSVPVLPGPFSSAGRDAAKPLLDAYTDCLCGDLEGGRGSLPGHGRALDTLYVGGGTPSLLGGERLARILESAKKGFSFSGSGPLEITLEANPAAVAPRDLEILRRSGFNRLSLGIQSGLDSELSALGRRHTAEEGAQAVRLARLAGFDNISADLMMGIPGQTRDSLARSLEFLAGLEVEHISAYLLKIEENTPYFRENTQELCPGEEEAADLYLQAAGRLARLGYIQYEVSNFAKRGLESRHNLKYWRCREYLGLGPSAHSFLGGRRFYFPESLEDYLGAADLPALSVDDGPGGSPEEQVMLRLRLAEGLEWNWLESAFPAFGRALTASARPLEKQGLLSLEDGRVRLTAKGFLLSNQVIGRLLDALSG